MIEFGLCVIFLVVGIAIGYTVQPKQPIQEPSELNDKIDKLEKELIIYKNLKESLLNDVRYWKSRVEK